MIRLHYVKHPEEIDLPPNSWAVSTNRKLRFVVAAEFLLGAPVWRVYHLDGRPFADYFGVGATCLRIVDRNFKVQPPTTMDVEGFFGFMQSPPDSTKVKRVVEHLEHGLPGHMQRLLKKRGQKTWGLT